jgi:hypothetical protein
MNYGKKRENDEREKNSGLVTWVWERSFGKNEQTFIGDFTEQF